MLELVVPHHHLLLIEVMFPFDFLNVEDVLILCQMQELWCVVCCVLCVWCVVCFVIKKNEKKREKKKKECIHEQV